MPRSATSHILGLAAVLACGLAIAACGGSSSKSSRAASLAAAKSSHFLGFSQCMRSHGVPNFPDPSGSGGGIQINASSGINPFSPAFKAAQSDCSKLMPGGGPFRGKPSAQVEAQMLGTSKCMRAHGVTGFPDPTTTQPSGPGNFSLALGHDGLFLVVPKTINPNSPAFEQAAKTCHFG